MVVMRMVKEIKHCSLSFGEGAGGEASLANYKPTRLFYKSLKASINRKIVL